MSVKGFSNWLMSNLHTTMGLGTRRTTGHRSLKDHLITCYCKKAVVVVQRGEFETRKDRQTVEKECTPFDSLWKVKKIVSILKKMDFRQEAVPIINNA